MQVRILSLDPEDMMSALAVQMVSAVPESLLFIDSPAADIAGKGEDASGAGGLFLNIGVPLPFQQFLGDIAFSWQLGKEFRRVLDEAAR